MAPFTDDIQDHRDIVAAIVFGIEIYADDKIVPLEGWIKDEASKYIYDYITSAKDMPFGDTRPRDLAMVDYPNIEGVEGWMMVLIPYDSRISKNDVIDTLTFVLDNLKIDILNFYTEHGDIVISGVTFKEILLEPNEPD